MKKIWRLWLLLPLLLCLASCAKQQETAGLLWIKNFSGTEGVYDFGLTAMDEAFVLQTVAGPASIHPRTSDSTTACPLPDGSYRLLGGDRLYVLDAQDTVHTMGWVRIALRCSRWGTSSSRTRQAICPRVWSAARGLRRCTRTPWA